MLTVIEYFPLNKLARVVEIEHGQDMAGKNIVYADNIPHSEGDCEWCTLLLHRIWLRTKHICFTRNLVSSSKGGISVGKVIEEDKIPSSDMVERGFVHLGQKFRVKPYEEVKKIIEGFDTAIPDDEILRVAGDIRTLMNARNCRLQISYSTFWWPEEIIERPYFS